MRRPCYPSCSEVNYWQQQPRPVLLKVRLKNIEVEVRTTRAVIPQWPRRFMYQFHRFQDRRLGVLLPSNHKTKLLRIETQSPHYIGAWNLKECFEVSGCNTPERYRLEPDTSNLTQCLWTACLVQVLNLPSPKVNITWKLIEGPI